MKIQDIFKLNLKTRGGVKLFHRIMNRYGIPKEDNVKLKQNVEIASSCGGSSTNFPYRITYFKVNNTNWASLADFISIYYPIIATVNLDNGKGEKHLVDRSILNDVRIFTVIDWDIVTPEYSINLDFVFKALEGSPEVDYVEEITQEEYNNIKNQL